MDSPRVQKLKQAFVDDRVSLTAFERQLEVVLLDEAQIGKRVEPLEGTNMSLWNSIIPDWWSANIYGTVLYGDADLANRVWVAHRCQQMNAQQIASMPLEFHGGEDEPAWISNPDPNWFPNGIGDALHAVVDQMYGWGFAILYVTDTYSNGFPRSWTVLPSGDVKIRMVDGAREYRRQNDTPLNPRRVVQIDRNPGISVHGCSALRAYAQMAYGLLAAGNQSLSVNQGGIPQALLKANATLNAEQAAAIKEAWMASPANGAPKVIGKDLEFEALSFDPKDLALLETQEFNAKAIATAYGVPSVLLNMALQGGLTYQNPGALGEMWWRFELRPTATRIANAFSAQMLPRGQWVSFDAADTFAELSDLSDDDDEQLSQVAKASPAQQTGRPLAAVGGGSG